MSLKRSLYTLILYLVFPLVLVRLLLRSRANPEYRKRWAERLGLIKPVDKQSVIWIHAVSVGEVIASKPLVEALFDTYTGVPILLTTTTPTGSDRVRSMFANQIAQQKLVHSYFPYDLLGAVSRFIKIYKPKILIVVETEIWPNLYAKCHQNEIPVLMVNARLSEKSTLSYLKIKGLVSETLSKVNVIAVRSKTDAQRFSQLGATLSQIQEIGNIKYDISIDSTQEKNARELLGIMNASAQEQRVICVAASTHKGEDSKILITYLKLLKQFPSLLLILVPRHPERFDEVYQDCIRQFPEQLSVMRYSQSKELSEFDGLKVKVILGDTMGEMQMWYALADVVFIGGSLVKTGGHNPLEATLYGVPVVSGPHMFNFEDVASQLIEKDLLYVCDDELDVTNKIELILKDKLHNQDYSSREYENTANDFMQQHQGVTARLLTIVSNEMKV